MRQAGASFPRSTSSSEDHFHPRFVLSVDDAGLEVLAALWQACEALEMPPRQLMRVIQPMLPKPKGGNRLMVLYAGMYRVWQG
eukprot:9373976-Pyramimonas_sp.AAC.1